MKIFEKINLVRHKLIRNGIIQSVEMAVYFLVDPKVEFSGNDCPYYAFGRAYIRVETRTGS